MRRTVVTRVPVLLLLTCKTIFATQNTTSQCIAAADIATSVISQGSFLTCLRDRSQNARQSELIKFIPATTPALQRAQIKAALTNGCTGALGSLMNACQMPLKCALASNAAMAPLAASAGQMGEMSKCKICRALCTTASCGDATGVPGGVMDTCSPTPAPTTPTTTTTTTHKAAPASKASLRHYTFPMLGIALLVVL